MLNYTDPTITKWEVDNLGNKVSVEIQNESKQIVGAKIVLEGMPDEYYRVQIEGFIEIDIKDKITNLNQFKVDYRKTGIVYFHPEIEAQTVVIERYYSKGLVYFPASRIWTTVDDLGEVIDTLDMSIDKIEFVNDSLVGYEDLISEANSVSSTLQSRTVTGQSLSTELSGKISAGSTLKTELSSATTAADTKKTELTNTTTTANNTKTQLDTSITNAGTSKSNLDGSILTGDILKSDLDDRISTGNTLKNNLDDDIVAGNLLKVDLSPLIVSSTTAKNNLDGSISSATTSKNNLDGSISTANSSKTNLDISIANANTINNTLSNASTGTIKRGTDINTTLNTSITTADTSKSDLDDSILEASTSKSNLDGSILTAGATKSGLDGSIVTGDNLKDELDAIISGTDYEQVIVDVAALKTGKVDKIVGKQLSTEDYTNAEKTKLSGIATGAQVNTVTSVAAKTGVVVLTKSDVQLGDVDNTSDMDKPVSTTQQTALNLKADKTEVANLLKGLTWSAFLA